MTLHASNVARPCTSSVNFSGPNQTLSNLVEAQLGPLTVSGITPPRCFAIFVSSPCAIVVDVFGLTLRRPWSG